METELSRKPTSADFIKTIYTPHHNIEAERVMAIADMGKGVEMHQ